jgi:hypothetical protein
MDEKKHWATRRAEERQHAGNVEYVLRLCGEINRLRQQLAEKEAQLETWLRPESPTVPGSTDSASASSGAEAASASPQQTGCAEASQGDVSSLESTAPPKEP